MNLWTLLRRNLSYHARAHLSVALGVAIGSTVLTGALVVGDSVRDSLRDLALAGLGKIEFALSSPDRTVTGDLAARMSGANAGDTGGLATALLLPGMAAREDGTARANQVNVMGVADVSIGTSRPSSSLWNFAAERGQQRLAAGEVWVNQALATQLKLVVGDAVIVRVAKPSALSREAALSPRSERTTALRLRVGRVLNARELGDFSLRPSQIAPLNAFVELGQLQGAAGLTGRVNTLVCGNIGKASEGQLTPKAGANARVMQELFQGLGKELRLDDLEASLREIPGGGLELRSRRVFVDPPLARAAEAAFSNATPLVTYLANLLIKGTNATPYSMVTATGPPYTPPDMVEDEILLMPWLAEDLGARAGESIDLVYFAPESGAQLLERTNRFRIRDVLPAGLPWSDRTLMPDFPGIEKAESTRDWDAGFPLEYRIRPKDEDYWRQNRGTPKAFVTLAAGQRLWGNRFGNVTAIRVTADGQGFPDATAVEKALLSRLKPEDFGLNFEAVRARALKGVAESQDFGGLFLGFSLFLVVAALLLMGLLFRFGLEQRAAETGTLLAMGFRGGQVRRMLLGEAAVVAMAGGFVGALGGVGYAQAMLAGLTGIWRNAVGTSELHLHLAPLTVLAGGASGGFVALLTIWLTLRKQARQPVPTLLAGPLEEFDASGSRGWFWVGAAAATAGAAIVGWAVATGNTMNPGAFFGAGALVLGAGLALTRAWLGSIGKRAGGRFDSLAALGVSGCARRRKRSVATVAMLACGSFLILAIGVFRLDANRDAAQRTSGTGGFALLGETAVPVLHDLNSAVGREYYGLADKDMTGVQVLALRVREGDQASCLNLSRAQKPRLLGVNPERLNGRFTFAKVAAGGSRERGWELLRANAGGKSGTADEVPVLGDANSLEWALGKKVGDTIDYTDEQGRPFKLRVVGAVANSILQGNLMVDEAEFVRRFPGQSGYRMFLVDAPSNRVDEISRTLSRALQDDGLEMISTVRRLEAFNAVQNTYLGTFQVLGGLGLLMGSAGLGIVVLRNVWERRGELGLLVALGFRRRTITWLLLSEHGVLLVIGLALGLAAAATAVLPALASPGARIPLTSLALTLVAVMLNGAAWTWAATRHSLRGDLLDNLRNE